MRNKKTNETQNKQHSTETKNVKNSSSKKSSSPKNCG